MAKKMNMSLVALLGCLGLLLLLGTHTQVEGGVYVDNECPEGKSIGDTWRPDPNVCEKCECHGRKVKSGPKVSCYTCPNGPKTTKTGYVEDMSKEYPDCCPKTSGIKDPQKP